VEEAIQTVRDAPAVEVVDSQAIDLMPSKTIEEADAQSDIQLVTKLQNAWSGTKQDFIKKYAFDLLSMVRRYDRQGEHKLVPGATTIQTAVPKLLNTSYSYFRQVVRSVVGPAFTLPEPNRKSGTGKRMSRVPRALPPGPATALDLRGVFSDQFTAIQDADLRQKALVSFFDSMDTGLLHEVGEAAYAVLAGRKQCEKDKKPTETKISTEAGNSAITHGEMAASETVHISRVEATRMIQDSAPEEAKILDGNVPPDPDAHEITTNSAKAGEATSAEGRKVEWEEMKTQILGILRADASHALTLAAVRQRMGRNAPSDSQLRGLLKEGMHDGWWKHRIARKFQTLLTGWYVHGTIGSEYLPFKGSDKEEAGWAEAIKQSRAKHAERRQEGETHQQSGTCKEETEMKVNPQPSREPSSTKKAHHISIQLADGRTGQVVKRSGNARSENLIVHVADGTTMTVMSKDYCFADNVHACLVPGAWLDDDLNLPDHKVSDFLRPHMETGKLEERGEARG